jgi:excisionase family DNA binding protein
MDTRFDLSDCVFSIKGGADHLKIGRSKLYQLIKEGAIRTAKIGRRTVIPGTEIKRFIKSLASRAV